jgi:CheY-like chemotaxis protein
MSDAAPPPPDAPAILVVDDERQIVDLLTRYLAQHGIRTLGAYAAEDAQRMVAADPGIAVVLTDVRMPGQSGVLLAEELLRGRPESAALEVVLVSGVVAGEPGIEAFGHRAFHVLSKPFRPSEVASVAARALAASQARRAAASSMPGGPIQTCGPDAPAVVGPRRGGAALAADAARVPAALRPLQLPEATLEALRTPLLPVLAAAEALATSPRLDAAEARRHAERIRDGALQLIALIDAAEAGQDPASTQTAA